MADANNNQSAPESKVETKSDLPHVESPSISPAISAQDSALASKIEASQSKGDNAIVLTLPAIRIPKFRMPKMEMPKFAMPNIGAPKISRRTQRNAFFTASLMMAACCGAAAGALAIVNTPNAVRTTDSLAEERIAFQKTVDQLGREIAALKTSFGNAGRAITTQNQAHNQQFAKLTERVDKIERAREATGSITPPSPQAAEIKDTPIPTPKPVVAQPTVLQGWTIVQARGNGVLVEGRGELFLARAGAQLPGLGAVESVKRDGNRWVVTTPKGIIVSEIAPQHRPRGYGYYGQYYRDY